MNVRIGRNHALLKIELGNQSTHFEECFTLVRHHNIA